MGLKDDVRKFERGRIRIALEKCNGNASSAARILEIQQSTLWRKIKALGLTKWVKVLRAEHELRSARKEEQ